MFRVAFSVWPSEPSFVLSLTLKAIIISPQYGVQSHRSDLGVQSHHPSTVWHLEFVVCSQAFRAIIHIQAFRAPFTFKHLEPCLQFGVQSHVFSLAFRVTIHFQFSIQSNHLFLFWCSEPPFLSIWSLEPLSLNSLAFKAIILS